MMNPEDALCYMEDSAMIRKIHAHNDRASQENHEADMLDIKNDTIRKLKANNEKLKEDLTKVAAQRNDTVAVVTASDKVIDMLSDELAKLKGIPNDVYKHQVNLLRSKEYDDTVEYYTEEGYITIDLRDDPEVLSNRPWYQKNDDEYLR